MATPQQDALNPLLNGDGGDDDEGRRPAEGEEEEEMDLERLKFIFIHVLHICYI